MTSALKAAACVGLLGHLPARPAPAQAASSAASAVPPDEQRAQRAYEVMQERFFLHDAGLYRDAGQTNAWLAYPYASNWSFTVAIQATMSLARLAPGQAEHEQTLRRLIGEGLERYWDEEGQAYNSDVLPPLGIGFGEYCFRFYDDNAHAALLLLDYAQESGEVWAQERAEAIFSNFIVQGIDADNPVMTGGIRWAQTPDGKSGADRCLVSNAPNALVGFTLYQRTGDQRFYDLGAGILAWCETYLRDERDGLYWDKVRADGTIDRTKWSYNQGFMVGVYLKLYELTQGAHYLQTAEDIAGAALRYHRDDVRNGIAGFLNQDPDFNAVFFRHLVPLLTVSENQGLHEAIRQTVLSYRDEVWESPEYHQPNGLFRLPCASTPLRMQAGMVEIYSIGLP